MYSGVEGENALRIRVAIIVGTTVSNVICQSDLSLADAIQKKKKIIKLYRADKTGVVC